MLGFGLAMDAFSVSLANGLNEPKMNNKKLLGIAGTFAVFQGIMPLIGWSVLKVAEHYFAWVEKLIPWVALLLLGFIGGKMIYEGITSKGDCPCEQKGLGFWALIVQGVATSIDALSVGFTISDYNWAQAAVCALLIALVTFGICCAGVVLGKKFGTALAGKSAIFGGAILIFIGLEIFITSFI